MKNKQQKEIDLIIQNEMRVQEMQKVTNHYKYNSRNKKRKIKKLKKWKRGD